MADAKLPLTTENSILRERKIKRRTSNSQTTTAWSTSPGKTLMDTNHWIRYTMYTLLVKLHEEVENVRTKGHQLVKGLGTHQLLQVVNVTHIKLI
jgi:hypothetical protein